MGGLPPVFIEFLGKTTGIKAAVRGVESEIAAVDAQGAGAFQKTGMMGKAAILGLGVAAVDVAIKTVHMAADFQTQMTRVQTGAGELKANLKSVGQGVLAMAGQVGQSTSQLTAGLYMTESAGYHGSAALEVLKNSAEGAKVGAADLHTVTDAVTTALNAYKMGADQSAQATNALIATEAEGKTNLEALAGSMASVLPTAAAAKVGLNEVLGAMATMTAQGTPAAVSATYLRQTIGALSNPSGKAAREMADLGLSAVKVGQNLGKNGLASTLEMLTTAITNRMGPAGTVLIQHLAKAAKNTTAYQKELANLSPSQQTYIGALATMVGGTKSMMAALELTGPHMADFKKNTEGVNERVKAGGKNIEGWAEVQKTFNQQAAQAKASLGAMGIQIGQYLMPYVQQLVSTLAKGTTWLTQHAMAAKIAAGVIGGVLVFALVAATAAMIDLAVAAAANPMTWIVLGTVAVIAAIVMLAMHWKQVWEGIKAVTAVVVGALVTAWGWLRDNTVGIWNDITGSVTGAWSATAAWFSSAWHTVVDPIVGAWNWLVSMTMAVWNGIASFFRKWWPLLLVIFALPIAVLLATWNHFHTQITAVAKAVWTAVAAFFVGIWKVILAAARLAWTAIRIAVIAPMTAAWHTLQSLWKTISGWLSTAWHAIRSVAASVWSSIRSAMTGPIVGAWHTITTTVDHIRSAIKTGLDKAWNAVSNIGSRFLSVGKAIVEGIVNGITNAGGLITDKLKNLAGDALDAAKSFLGINSPSKVFADQVGMAIPEGVAKGVTDHAHLAHNAVRSLAAGLPAAASLVGGSVAMGLGASGGASVIHQHLHVTVQGHVMTDRQLVDVVQEGFGTLGAQNPATWQPYKR